MRMQLALLGFCLTTAVSAAAQLNTQTLTGRVWIDYTPVGWQVTIDRSEKMGGPDGMLDDELVVFVDENSGSLDATAEPLEELKNARVSVSPHGFTVTDLDTKRIFVAHLRSSEPMSEESEPIIHGDGAALHGRKVRPTRTLVGYGIRHTPLNETRSALVERRAFGLETLSLCDAGDICAASQCSVQCTAISSCSITCNSGFNACCRCTGPNKKYASCGCAACV
jgi:hypothetical protein